MTIKEVITSIADAIREKTGKTEKIVGNDIPEAIRNVAALPPYEAGMYYNEIDASNKLVNVTLFGDIAPNKYVTNATTIRLENVEKIPDSFLINNATCTKLYLDDNITELGTKAFSHCTKLSKLYYPDGTENRIPAGVTVIPDKCFESATALKNLVWHDNITDFGKSAFSANGNATNTRARIASTSLPANLVNIGDYALNSQHIGLTEIPAKVQTIGKNAFQWNELLTTLTFKGTPTSIATNAFLNCANLTTINVPWAEGAVANAPWGATNATINYNYTGG
jgi:hypothetical protein